MMLYTLAVMVLVLWLLGMFSGYAGGLVHLLLVVVLVIVVLGFIGRNRAS